MDDRIGWLKISPRELAEILRGKRFYGGLEDADDLQILDLRMTGTPDVPIVMIGVRTSCLDPVNSEEFVAPTISMNPDLV